MADISSSTSRLVLQPHAQHTITGNDFSRTTTQMPFSKSAAQKKRQSSREGEPGDRFPFSWHLTTSTFLFCIAGTIFPSRRSPKQEIFVIFTQFSSIRLNSTELNRQLFVVSNLFSTLSLRAVSTLGFVGLHWRWKARAWRLCLRDWRKRLGRVVLDLFKCLVASWHPHSCSSTT